MTEAMIEKLKRLARREMWPEYPDFDPYRFASGSCTEAYYSGAKDGEILLAREVLESASIDWKV